MVKCVFLIHEGSLDHTRVYAKMTWMGTGHVGKTNRVIRGPLEALSHVLSAQPPPPLGEGRLSSIMWPMSPSVTYMQ